MLFARNIKAFVIVAICAPILLCGLLGAAVAQEPSELPPPPPPPESLESTGPTEPAKPIEPETNDSLTPSEPLESQPERGLELGPQETTTETPPPGPVHRLIRVSALTLAAYSFLAFTPFMSLGLDLAIFGQEFHDQARTFSAMNASIGVLWATTTIWPLGLALDGNGDFWATTLSAAAAGGAAIGFMYLYAQDDPDILLFQSFTPGVMAFVTAIVVYEMTSDTSARYQRDQGADEAGLSVTPTIAPSRSGGWTFGAAGRF